MIWIAVAFIVAAVAMGIAAIFRGGKILRDAERERPHEKEQR